MVVITVTACLMTALVAVAIGHVARAPPDVADRVVPPGVRHIRAAAYAASRHGRRYGHPVGVPGRSMRGRPRYGRTCRAGARTCCVRAWPCRTDASTRDWCHDTAVRADRAGAGCGCTRPGYRAVVCAPGPACALHVASATAVASATDITDGLLILASRGSDGADGRSGCFRGEEAGSRRSNQKVQRAFHDLSPVAVSLLLITDAPGGSFLQFIFYPVKYFSQDLFHAHRWACVNGTRDSIRKREVKINRIRFTSGTGQSAWRHAVSVQYLRVPGQPGRI